MVTASEVNPVARKKLSPDKNSHGLIQELTNFSSSE